MKKRVPALQSEDEVREFWDSTDSSDVVDWKKARRVLFPRLRPSLRTISLRLPEMMIQEIKVLANKRDVPYQSLLKIFLAERIERELQASEPSRLLKNTENGSLLGRRGGGAQIRAVKTRRI